MLSVSMGLAMTHHATVDTATMQLSRHGGLVCVCVGGVISMRYMCAKLVRTVVEVMAN